jgi:hypothetical protein
MTLTHSEANKTLNTHQSLHKLRMAVCSICLTSDLQTQLQVVETAHKIDLKVMQLSIVDVLYDSIISHCPIIVVLNERRTWCQLNCPVTTSPEVKVPVQS